VIGLVSSVATLALASALAVQSLGGLPRPGAQLSQGGPPPAQPPLPVGSPVITVEAGAFDPATQAEVQEFLPRTVRVPVGGAIRWHVNGFHNVAFPSGAPPPEFILPVPGSQDVQVNPRIAFPVQTAPTYDGTIYFNSGLPQPDQQNFEWTLTFSKVGAFSYLCSVHPNMQAVVVVEPPGTAVPTQDEVTAQGQRETQQYMVDAQLALDRQQAPVPATAPGGTWTVSMDAPNSPHFALQRFFPQAITIQAGDTIRWVNPALTEPHTVTFRAGAPREAEFVPVPQPNGPPMIQGNRRVLAPVVPSGSYDGQSYANSGFLGEGFPFGRDFRLTFAQPGTYQYVCVLHEDLGMSGFVVVTPPS
jgi:plastocyanin